jgi:hypothetical protein
MKVVFVDDGPAAEALGAEYQIERLAHGRLSGIVAADEQGVPWEVDLPLSDATVVLEAQSPDAHGLPVVRRANIEQLGARNPHGPAAR